MFVPLPLETMPLLTQSQGPIAPNPWKIVIFFYELNLPFEMRTLDRMDPEVRKSAPLVDITPNGRMPALVDPNKNVKLWESGAIIE
jgi:glutathione S-transferase